MQNTRGRLVRWTLENGRVVSSAEELLSLRLSDGVKAIEMDLLQEVAEHLGQDCLLVEKFAEDHPASFLVRFDDGYELYCFLGDVVFD